MVGHPASLFVPAKKLWAADLAVPNFAKNLKVGQPSGMPSWESRLPPFPQSMNKGGRRERTFPTMHITFDVSKLYEPICAHPPELSVP
jgi:hypothetical protein